MQPITKSRRDWKVIPNLPDYEQTRAAFSWGQARRALDGLPGGHGLNIAHEAVDRHAAGPCGHRVAIHWIGKGDPVALEIVKAFVSLKAGFEPSEQLHRDLLGHARKRLGTVVAAKEIEFVASLPKNRAWNIMRRLLKARALGLPEGDVSTLESI